MQNSNMGFNCSRRRNRPVKKIKYSCRVPRPGIEPGTPGSVIERHNHEAKRSGPVRLVIYAPYIFTYILIICTSFCRATTLLHPTMKHLYQMFSTIPRLFCDSVAIASPLGSDGSHPGHGTTCSRRRNRPVKKIFPSSAPTRDRTRYPWICNRAS